MKFKRIALKDQFWCLYPKLRLILCDLDYYSILLTGKEILLTSIYRKGDKGVHGSWRGTDARVEFDTGKRIIRYYTNEEIRLILQYIKKKYVYDRKRPQMKTIIYHRVEGSTHHFHLQTMPE